MGDCLGQVANIIDRQFNDLASIPGLGEPLIPRLTHPSSHKSRKKNAYNSYFVKHPPLYDILRRNPF